MRGDAAAPAQTGTKDEPTRRLLGGVWPWHGPVHDHQWRALPACAGLPARESPLQNFVYRRLFFGGLVAKATCVFSFVDGCLLADGGWPCALIISAAPSWQLEGCVSSLTKEPPKLSKPEHVVCCSLAPTVQKACGTVLISGGSAMKPRKQTHI